MNRLKTTPVNKYTNKDLKEINEILMSFAAYIVLMLVTVFGLMLLATIN
jgi:hypothetical protein